MATDNLVDTASNGAASGDLVGALLERKDLLVPTLVGLAGAVAAAKGPSVVRELSGSVEGKGQSAESAAAKTAEGAKEKVGDGGLVGKATSKLTDASSGSGKDDDRDDGGKDDGGGGGKKTRRLPIQRWTDVAVPIEQAYEAWTKFDEYPKFMHRVLSVETKGEDKISWQEKIWFSTRQWEGRITERRKNDRIVWKTTSGMNHKGIVSFHKLGDRLTRVMVEMEFEPTGMIEKMGSGLRFVKRAVQSDLARFKAFVEMQDAKGIEYRSAGQQDSEENRDGSDEKQDDSEARKPRQRRSKSRAASSTRSSSTSSSTSSRKRAPAKR
jgi:uncharacterized membrane protein